MHLPEMRNLAFVCVIAVGSFGLNGCGDSKGSGIHPSPFPKDRTRHADGPAGLEYCLLFQESIHLVNDPHYDGYEQDLPLRFDGFSFAGGAVIYVNDSPINKLGHGGELFRISEWLVPGKNTIRIEGDFQSQLHIKVFALPVKEVDLLPDPKTWRMIAKTRISPNKSSNENSLEFVCDGGIDSPPFFDELPADPDGKKKINEEVRIFLNAVFDPLQRRDFDQFRKMAVAPWADRPHWSMAFKEDYFPRFRKLVESSNSVLVTKPEDFQLIIGRYCVLVVSGEHDETLHDFHSLHYESRESHTKIYERPMRLVRISGHWEVWNG
jgi:hypothetical protein